jgi:D-amino peptidase
LKPLASARREIEDAVKAAVAEAKKSSPQRQASYRVQVRYRNFTYPEVASAFREIEIVAPDTVAFTRPTMPEAYRLIRVLYRFINPD